MPIVNAGAEGLVVYQETYNRAVYSELHTAGPKRDFNFRLDCVGRGYAAGFRRLGIGVLIGLTRWQDDAVALAAHLEYLLRHCWQAQITVSVPRLRPAAGGFRPLFSMTDRELAQLVCALRITFPLALPAFLSALVLNFLRGLRSFETPVLQGTPAGIKVFVNRVYDSVALEFNTGLATAYSMVLVVLSVITLLFYVRATRFSERYATITGKGYRVKVVDIGKWKYVTFLAVLGYFLVGIDQTSDALKTHILQD